MSPQTKGSIYGILSAVSYGTNPLGALFLYKVGITADSVLFYRYLLAALLLVVLMKIRKIPFGITLKEGLIFCGLGILFATSSLTLFNSFFYIEVGVASTLLFVYPIIVAVIMALFFKEKVTLPVILSILSALGGVALLYGGTGEGSLRTTGIALVMASSLSYALYIIIINQTKIRIPSIKLTFYVLLWCILTIVAHSFMGATHPLQRLTTPYMWFFAVLLALFPTVISLVTMAIGIRLIGPTPIAILGALEPLTTVTIGVVIFQEPFTGRLAGGILLILIGVMLILIRNSSTPHPWRKFRCHIAQIYKRE
ncbi:MAG: DMT family transporter [Porphyromonadaceae bacterium]|nr:DMT family transporter [Porphyromonadaceae bacterium]